LINIISQSFITWWLPNYSIYCVIAIVMITVF